MLKRNRGIAALLLSLSLTACWNGSGDNTSESGNNTGSVGIDNIDIAPIVQSILATGKTVQRIKEKGIGGMICSLLEGNPCNAATGNKVESVVDYQSATGDLVVSRTYQSIEPRKGLFGEAWSGMGSAQILIYAGSPNTVDVREASGRQTRWVRVLGLWLSEPDITFKLSSDASGYRIKHINGTVERYDTTGRLQTITAKNGLQAQYRYNAANELVEYTSP